jgi:cytochrome c-type biogenesis protein CcmH/NrfG
MYTQILEDLLDEYDQAPHAWHLLGLARFGGGDYDQAMAALVQGRKLLNIADPDEDTVALFDELDARVHEALKAGDQVDS